MDRERVEAFTGRLVRVDLDGGQNLAGELKIHPFQTGALEVLEDEDTHVVFWPENVVDIMLLHPAEAEGMKHECSCNDADLMSWTTCPRHRFDGQ